MARVRRVNTTKYEIVRCATKLFMKHGFSSTSPKMICELMNISTGNITYYFPTKEHLLLEMVDMLCHYQWETMQETGKSEDPIKAICAELSAVLSMCDISEIAKDFFVAIYSSPLCMEAVRENDIRRAKAVFKAYCPDWTEEDYREAETLASGIEYASIMTTPSSPSLDTRILGALNAVLTIYGVPQEERERYVQETQKLDHEAIGQRVLKEFKDFTEQTGDRMLEQLLQLSREREKRKRGRVE